MSSSAIEAVSHGPLMPEQTAAHSRKWFEQVIHLALLACAFISILTTVGIVVVLVVEAAAVLPRSVDMASF